MSAAASSSAQLLPKKALDESNPSASVRIWLSPMRQMSVSLPLRHAVPALLLLQVLLLLQFWLLWLMIVSSASAGLNVAACYKQFA
jgi:hypothetical protein